TRAGHAADDVVHGDEYVSPPVRTVHECGVERQMPASDVDAWRLRGNQRKRDADVVAASQQMLRIVETEGEPEQRRDRPERDIALFPRKADAEHVVSAVPFAAADHPVIGYRARVGSGLRAGERKARYLQPFREPRQVVVLLLVRAVVQQQLGRTQRIRDHDGNGGGGAPRAQLHYHFGMSQRRKSQSAVLLGDDHAEETAVLDELPYVRGQVAQLM